MKHLKLFEEIDNNEDWVWVRGPKDLDGIKKGDKIKIKATLGKVYYTRYKGLKKTYSDIYVKVKNDESKGDNSPYQIYSIFDSTKQVLRLKK